VRVGSSFFVTRLTVALCIAEYLVQKDGRPHVETLRAGDYFGEGVMVDERKYSATVLALHTTVCFKLDRETLQNTLGLQKMKGRKGSTT
jgi:CRP-like cAMP-binding protein